MNEILAASNHDMFPSDQHADTALTNILQNHFGKDHDFALAAEMDCAVSIARILNRVLIRSHVHDGRYTDAFQRLLEVRNESIFNSP